MPLPVKLLQYRERCGCHTEQVERPRAEATHRESVEEVNEHGSSERTISASHEGFKSLPEETSHSLHIQVPHGLALDK